MKNTVLLTGGMGFIGSHTAVELINAGYDTVIVDDLSNSSEDVLDRIEKITGIRPVFYKCDCADKCAMENIFQNHNIDSIIHFAGFKAVGESVQKPLMYYRNNIDTALTVLELMEKHGVKHFVFSSSATVYGANATSPITENAPTGACTNPYGQTKFMIEQILCDAAAASPDLSVVLLRYFNPIGAHESALLGEKPNGIPNNLMPYITQVAAGIREKLSVFGNDYPTHDGTGVRDYIHVVDLARGHVAALDWMGGRVGTGAPSGPDAIAAEPAPCGSRRGVGVFNLGTGTGSSVLDVIHSYERACGKELPYEIKPRRAGDIAENYAACDKAREELGWVAEYDLDRMCADSWRWQSTNPYGYEEA